MNDFTPISGLIGGFLIGLSAISFLYFNRQICGISGMMESVLPPSEKYGSPKLAFLIGLLTGGFILRYAYPTAFDFTLENNLFTLILAGWCVGFGSRLGKGCTSGHGICGVGRLAGRSIAATAIFFITAVITASTFYILRG